MFFHNLKYTFKTLFKNKMLIFWTFAFPIVMGTFFNLAFSDIENSEKLDIIDIAVVDNEIFKSNDVYKNAIGTLSDKDNEDRLFNTKYVSLKRAKRLLEDKKITGYVVFKDTPDIVVNSGGINETVFKYAIEEVIEQESIITNLVDQMIKTEVSNNPLVMQDMNTFYQKIYSEVNSIISNREVNIKDVSSANLSYTMIEFYTLIAMACLYGGILGMVAINQVLPNMSTTGKRVSISPAHKSSLLLSSVVAGYIIQLIGVLLLFLLTIFVLNVDYGDHLVLILLLSAVGSLAGLSLGIMIASAFRASDNTKTGIIISITMLCSFLSGMMGITMKYIIDKNMPIINKINPASMITDGFYSLYYYTTFDRFYFNLISLLIFSAIMIIIAIYNLRRNNYDSI